MFKNLQVYRLPQNWAMTADQLAQCIAPQAFADCTGLEMESIGWVSPRNNGELVYSLGKQMLLKLARQKKLLPSTVINQFTKLKVEEVEEQQGFKPGRKQVKEIKEQVMDDLLPKAFPVNSEMFVWIDPVNGWMCVDTSSPSKADDVLRLLLKAIDTFPVQTLHVAHSPSIVMTEWLVADEAPAGFTVDQDTELRSSGESKATVRYVHHTLEGEDVRRHIASGKQCTRLAMTWSDKISFVLTETMAIKRIIPLDVIKQDMGVTAQNDDERFDGDFQLMTGEFNQLLSDLLAVFGGEAADQKDLVTEGAKTRTTAILSNGDQNVPDDAALYDQAVAVVKAIKQPSVSAVQRHLRIGYNRAARLLEQMEANGVVSPSDSTGVRTLLKDAA